MNIKALVLLSALLTQPAWAGSPSEIESETRRLREKESGRAREMAQSLGDREDFDEKYKPFKESDPELFSAALEKRQLAAKAWQTAAEALTKVNSYEEANSVKAAAQDAEDVAEIARMEMRAAGAEKEWKRIAEKYKSRESEALAGQLIQNQRNLIQTTKQRMLSQKQLRQLEIERNQLNAKIREMQDHAREKEQNKRDRESSRDRGNNRDHDKEKDRGNDNVRGKPDRILVE